MIGIGPPIDPKFVQAASEAYGKAFLEDLRLRFPFSRTTDPRWIRRHLTQWGAFYLQEKQQQAERRVVHASLRRHKAQFQQVAEAAAALRSALDRLEPEAAKFFWRDVRAPMLMMVRSLRTEGTPNPAYNASGQSVPVALLDEERLVASVDILENMAADACRWVTFKDGKPRNEALQRWVAQMRLLYVSDFGQAFTFSNGPDGPSMALQFCDFAMKPLDSEVTERELSWAIRSVIRSLHAARR